jgi:hypothetical protein
MDGLGPADGGSGGLAALAFPQAVAGAAGGEPHPAGAGVGVSRPEAGPLGQTGIPVRNVPLGTDVAGDTLNGGDALAHDGLAGNGLGVPMGDRLPVGTVQGLATQGTSRARRRVRARWRGSALGGGRVGRRLAAGWAAPRRACRSAVADTDLERPVGECRSSAEAGELPAADHLPVFGSMLNGGSLPTRANLNTLPARLPSRCTSCWRPAPRRPAPRRAPRTTTRPAP